MMIEETQSYRKISTFLAQSFVEDVSASTSPCETGSATSEIDYLNWGGRVAGRTWLSTLVCLTQRNRTQ